jgi:hypothetical protein
MAGIGAGVLTGTAHATPSADAKIERFNVSAPPAYSYNFGGVRSSSQI